MGFEKDVSQIIATLDGKSVQKRQTVLLSATLSLGKFLFSLVESFTYLYNV